MDRKQSFYERYIKRVLDIVCALAALLIFVWLYLLVAVLVRFKLGAPVLFVQPRPGKDEKIFKLYKFRTMTDAQDEHGELLPDEIRLTAFGRSLRATSLDELPEVFNILKGDMSVVGNRPLPIYEAEQLTSDNYIERFMAPSGLTGLWQVEKRGNGGSLSPEERKQLDIKYARTFSFSLDMKIIIRTFTAFIQEENV